MYDKSVGAGVCHGEVIAGRIQWGCAETMHGANLPQTPPRVPDRRWSR